MLRRMNAICAAAALTACPGPYGDGFFGEFPEFQAGGGAPPIEWPAAPAVPEAEPLQGDACLWNGDCPTDAYCRRPAGRCFGPGVCQRPAEDCGPEAPPRLRLPGHHLRESLRGCRATHQRRVPRHLWGDLHRGRRLPGRRRLPKGARPGHRQRWHLRAAAVRLRSDQPHLHGVRGRRSPERV